ncbi:MAG: hypothetical protein ACM3MD_07750 [Betaproteobacteria bacterium]
MNGTKTWISPIPMLLLLVICIGAATFACHKVDHTGKYISEKYSKNYLELKADGTFILQQDPMIMAGKYKIAGDLITLKTDTGFNSIGKIEGKSIIDNDGVRWTKQ